MNRTNRSGILKAGVIGGKNQNGTYKIDARFNKNSIIERIKKLPNIPMQFQYIVKIH
jgi:putative adenine-specific DNA methyltransferase